MTTATPSTSSTKISRDDIESKFRELQGDVQDTADDAKSYVLVAAAVIIVGFAAMSFVLGRRRGRKKTTIVEIRRV